MNNKTCGECKYFNPISGICIKLGKKPSRTMPSCPYRPTNGDRIRQMSNEELAEWFALCCMCDTCHLKGVECAGDGETARTYAHCYDKFNAWLNAPADCAGKDINVRTKESEGEDE